MSYTAQLLGKTFQKNVSFFRVSTPLGDDNTRGTDNLSGVTFSVDLAQTSPFTQLLGV